MSELAKPDVEPLPADDPLNQRTDEYQSAVIAFGIALTGTINLERGKFKAALNVNEDLQPVIDLAMFRLRDVFATLHPAYDGELNVAVRWFRDPVDVQASASGTPAVLRQISSTILQEPLLYYKPDDPRDPATVNDPFLAMASALAAPERTVIVECSVATSEELPKKAWSWALVSSVTGHYCAVYAGFDSPGSTISDA